MTFGQLTVIALRIAVPLMILRRPLAGGIAALLLDVVIVELFGPAGMGQHYHSIDKVLDLYYLGLEAWVSRRWLPLTTRWISLVLYGYRALGAILFEIVHWRAAVRLPEPVRELVPVRSGRDAVLPRRTCAARVVAQVPAVAGRALCAQAGPGIPAPRRRGAAVGLDQGVPGM